jgi:hypothetical protein
MTSEPPTPQSTPRPAPGAAVQLLLLGGTDNFDADRRSADAIEKVFASIRTAAWRTGGSCTAPCGTWSATRGSANSSTSAPAYPPRTTPTRSPNASTLTPASSTSTMTRSSSSSPTPAPCSPATHRAPPSTYRPTCANRSRSSPTGTRPRCCTWYLAYLGVAPSRQNQGIGTALITGNAYRDRLPAYLEANAPRNRALYRRLGFLDDDRRVTGHDGSPVWPMWHQPPAS